MAKKTTKEEKAHALQVLKNNFKAGMTIYTILRHVSRSGMTRHISVVVIDREKEQQYYYNWHIAKVLHEPLVHSFFDALKVQGCGMDMGFDLVYRLGYALYPQGFGCLGPKCPSNDHSNNDRNYEKHTKKRPHWHKEGGYAFRHQWL